MGANVLGSILIQRHQAGAVHDNAASRNLLEVRLWLSGTCRDGRDYVLESLPPRFGIAEGSYLNSPTSSGCAHFHR